MSHTLTQRLVESDLERYLKQTALNDDDDTVGPPPPPKDNASIMTTSREPALSRENSGLARTNSMATSIFSFSRASFSSQLASLTSMNLPSASTLAANINAIPTALQAVLELTNAADQIRLYTKKALKVLGNMDAEDDVEWAAAAGRDGLEDTDTSVRKFERLVTVYVEAIDRVQSRPDVAGVPSEQLEHLVVQMDSTLSDWTKVRSHLKGVRDQVELAMEWEELWNVVLGDVGNEMEELNTLIFEMEEKRYKSMSLAENDDSSFDMKALESVLDASPQQFRTPTSNRFSLPPSAFVSSPINSPILETNPQDDSNLLAIFARMQPLRASLDFLPMRLSMFQQRAEKVFPTACEELGDKRKRLERNWTKMQKDADTLRKELEEDRWVLVFRNAGKQANKMCESVERSILKLQEAYDQGMHHTSPHQLAKRIENFEAKRTHYGPAIDKVVQVVEKGVKDRLTVNGEILRLQADISARVRHLKESIRVMEQMLDHLNAHKNSQMRDSISSIHTMDRSMSESLVDTPDSSPPSSVIASNSRQKLTAKKNRSRRPSQDHPPPVSQNKRYSSLPGPPRPTTPLHSVQSSKTSPRKHTPSSGGLQSVYKQGTYRPPVAPVPRPQPTPLANKPRWTTSTNVRDLHQAFSSDRSSPYLRTASSAQRSMSSAALPSPLSRETMQSPAFAASSQYGRSGRLASFTERVANASPNGGLIDRLPYQNNRHATAPHSITIRSPSSMVVQNESSPTMTTAPTFNHGQRPPSSLTYGQMSWQGFGSRATSSIPQGPEPSHSTDMRRQQSIDFSQYTTDDIDYTTNDHRAARELENEPDDEPTSSPLAPRQTESRAGNRASMSSRTGKRLSMLPVPTNRMPSMSGSVSGRDSTLGY